MFSIANLTARCKMHRALDSFSRVRYFRRNKASNTRRRKPDSMRGRFYVSSAVDPFLSQLNPILSVTFSFSKVDFCIILQSPSVRNILLYYKM